MKIQYWLPHTKIAGGPKIVLTQASKLAERGHDVRVFTMHTGWRERIFPGANWRSQFKVPVYFVRDWKEALVYQPDVIIADAWQSAKRAIELSPKGKLFEIVQHDERLYHGNPTVVDQVFRSPKLKKIVVATWLKELFKNEFGLDAELIMNTIDRKAFFPIPELRKKDGKVHILLLVHSYLWKGTQDGIEIVQNLKERYPNIQLIGFGIRMKTPPSGIDEYHYNPSQKKLRELYASSDIFLCPSEVEGFGLPSLEAMACGATLVTYENGGSRDFATDGVTALVAPRKDKAALATKLEEVVKDETLRLRLSEQGVAFVQTLPTWEDQIAKLEAVLMK